MRILQFIIVLAIWMLSMGSGLSYGAQLPELKISWHKDSLQGKERVSLSVRNDSVILAWTEDSSYRYKLDNTEIGKVKKLLQGKHLLSTDTVTFQWPDFPSTDNRPRETCQCIMHLSAVAFAHAYRPLQRVWYV